MADLQRAACNATNTSLVVPQVAAVEANRTGVNSAPGRFCRAVVISWIQFANGGAGASLGRTMLRSDGTLGANLGTSTQFPQAAGAAPYGSIMMMTNNTTDADTLTYSESVQQAGAGGASSIGQQCIATFVIS